MCLFHNVEVGFYKYIKIDNIRNKNITNNSLLSKSDSSNNVV
jgi:hypothetical protein